MAECSPAGGDGNDEILLLEQFSRASEEMRAGEERRGGVRERERVRVRERERVKKKKHSSQLAPRIWRV